VFVVVDELSNVFVVELIIGKLDVVYDEFNVLVKFGVGETSFENVVELEVVVVVKLGIEDTSLS
jgi:hypothetical protein